MSDTQSYKTVTFASGELLAIAYALDARLIQLKAVHADQAILADLVKATEAALAKVEAAL